MLGPSVEDVSTGTEAVRISWTVPAISVLTCFSVQLPMRVTLEALGAKQEILFLDATAEAKAPDESSCIICRPALFPVKPDNFSWKPVISTSLEKRKS